MASDTGKKNAKSQLAESAYNSPYSHHGAPQPHPNGDPYESLRRSALCTLEAMGYDPKTMVERGVIWAEDQDPFGHVTQAQYMHFFGNCFHRVMEGYDEFLSQKEYDDMIKARSVIPAIRKYEISIKRQVIYPDSLISAYRQEVTQPTRNGGTTSLFSLKQQAIVAECKGSVTYMDAKSGRPVDIRTVSPGWSALYDGLNKKCESAKALKENWECEHRKSKL
ncbi:hypothetical protein F4808DRAFT_471782 [Astrocystis sublimbata]|nr:hypothetical protein F4808DRAFT_471782 [Astrocystis sublimbata]